MCQSLEASAVFSPHGEDVDRSPRSSHPVRSPPEAQVGSRVHNRGALHGRTLQGMELCTRCGHENDAGARYCNACGNQLWVDETREERKIVTVLFVDLAGFTARADHLDPED